MKTITCLKPLSTVDINIKNLIVNYSHDEQIDIKKGLYAFWIHLVHVSYSDLCYH